MTVRMTGRRLFLGGLGGIAAAGAGIVVATRRPAPTLVTFACQKETTMSTKILVAYATRTGSTAEVAEAIAHRLCEAGLSAEVRPVADVATKAKVTKTKKLPRSLLWSPWLPNKVTHH